MILLVGMTSLVIGQAWFWMIPIDNWDGTGALFFPFPFAEVQMIIDRT